MFLGVLSEGKIKFLIKFFGKGLPAFREIVILGLVIIELLFRVYLKLFCLIE
jgi:hypothetical protein